METNKYYALIEELVKNHRKYSGMESMLADIVKDVYEKAEPVINSASDESSVEKYLVKLVSVTMLSMSKRQTVSHNNDINSASQDNEVCTEVSEQNIENACIDIEEQNTPTILLQDEIDNEAESEEIENSEIQSEESANKNGEIIEDLFGADVVENIYETSDNTAQVELVFAPEIAEDDNVENVEVIEGIEPDLIKPNQELVDKMINGSIEDCSADIVDDIYENEDSSDNYKIEFEEQDSDFSDNEEGIVDSSVEEEKVEDLQFTNTDLIEGNEDFDNNLNIEDNMVAMDDNIELAIDGSDALSLDSSESLLDADYSVSDNFIEEDSSEALDLYEDFDNNAEMCIDDEKKEAENLFIAEHEDSIVTTQEVPLDNNSEKLSQEQEVIDVLNESSDSSAKTNKETTNHIYNKIYELNDSFPDLHIYDIFEYKYIQKYSILEITTILNLDEDSVVSALNKIISVIEDL